MCEANMIHIHEVKCESRLIHKTVRELKILIIKMGRKNYIYDFTVFSIKTIVHV